MTARVATAKMIRMADRTEGAERSSCALDMVSADSLLSVDTGLLRGASAGGARPGGEAQGGEFSRTNPCEARHSPPTSSIDGFSGPSLGRALGRGGHRPSLLFSFNHPHDPLLRQVAAWIAYPLWIAYPPGGILVPQRALHFVFVFALLAVTSSMSFAQGPPPTSTNCKNCLDTSEFPDLALKILTHNDDSGNSLSCAVSAAITKVSFANDDCTGRTTGCSEASCTFVIKVTVAAVGDCSGYGAVNTVTTTAANGTKTEEALQNAGGPQDWEQTPTADTIYPEPNETGNHSPACAGNAIKFEYLAKIAGNGLLSEIKIEATMKCSSCDAP